MKYLVKDLEQILNAKKVNIVENKEITGIAIDSRKVKEGDLFIPFLGENVDGHNYIESAFEKGAAASLSLKEDFTIDTKDYAKENGGVIFPNPNAPTGVYMPLDQVEEICSYSSISKTLSGKFKR